MTSEVRENIVVDMEFKTDMRFIVFPAQPRREFRVVITTKHESTKLVVEDNQTHEKWACHIEDPSKHGPDILVSRQVLVATLESGLTQLNSAGRSDDKGRSSGEDDGDEKDKKDNFRKEKTPALTNTQSGRSYVTADMVKVGVEDNAMNLKLRIHVSTLPMWVPEYTFCLHQVTRASRVDALSDQWRSAQQKLKAYKLFRAQCCIHLINGDKYVCRKPLPNRHGRMQWKKCENEHQEVNNNSKLTLSLDGSRITVPTDGRYKVCIQVSNLPNLSQINLLLDGRVATTPAAVYENGVWRLHTTVYCEEGSTLSVSLAGVSSSPILGIANHQPELDTFKVSLLV